MKIEQIAISDLKKHPRNYKEHPEDQLEHIIKSIKEHGIYRNIIIAKDNTILAGHGVVEASKKMGKKKVPVLKLNIKPDNQKALKILIGDNEIAHLGVKDDRKMSEILKELYDVGDVDGLLGTGYDPSMLANLIFVTRPESEIADFNAAAEWVGLPEYEEGTVPIKLNVLFETEKDREAFLKKIKATVINKKTGKTWSIWYPEKPRNDFNSIRFESK